MSRSLHLSFRNLKKVYVEALPGTLHLYHRWSQQHMTISGCVLAQRWWAECRVQGQESGENLCGPCLACGSSRSHVFSWLPPKQVPALLIRYCFVVVAPDKFVFQPKPYTLSIYKYKGGCVRIHLGNFSYTFKFLRKGEYVWLGIPISNLLPSEI